MNGVLDECCTRLSLVFLEIAVPLSVAMWGGFWVWRRHWSTVPMHASTRRLCWVMLGCGVVTLAEMTVLVCVAASRR
jgi:hypothetical protein